MSALALQRVVVRMLFDPAFCQRVYADPETALQGEDLSAAERHWVVQPPPQAYGADIHRRQRALSGLLEEYPVAGALAIRGCQDLERLQGFFASAFFHQCVQQRGSMAAAFGDYLQSEAFAEQPEIARMAMLELGIGRVRRAPVFSSAPPAPCKADTRVRLAPWAALLSVPSATLQRYGRLLRHLQQHRATLLDAILDPGYRLPAAPRLRSRATEWVLVVGIPGSNGPSLEPASEELGALLSAAREDITVQELCTVAVRLGATPEEATDILAGLLADRLLTPVS